MCSLTTECVWIRLYIYLISACRPLSCQKFSKVISRFSKVLWKSSSTQNLPKFSKNKTQNSQKIWKWFSKPNMVSGHVPRPVKKIIKNNEKNTIASPLDIWNMFCGKKRKKTLASPLALSFPSEYTNMQKYNPFCKTKKMKKEEKKLVSALDLSFPS